MNGTVVVATFTHRYEAEIAAGFLENAGIAVGAFADDGGGTYPIGMSAAQVVVAHEDALRAREVLVDAGVIEG